VAGRPVAPRRGARVDAGVGQIEFLDSEIAAVERLIAQPALEWPEIRRLMTVPGVNLICAASLIAAIGDVGRCFTSRKLVGYLGLDPEVPSLAMVRRAAAGSANAARRPPAGRWSRPLGAWSASRGRCTPS
jgi:transposase